jgi:hypothetical protein
MNRRGYRNSRSAKTVGVRAGSDSDISHYQERLIYSGLQYSISKRFAPRRVRFSMLNDLNRTDNVPLRLSQAHF